MSAKAWIIFAVLCLGLIGGLVFINQQERVDVSNVDSFKLQSASEDNGNIADHVKGNNDAKVKIIEYGDFQCPGCASAAPILRQITEKYQDKVMFVFRNYPLPSIHPNARAAAAAAEAAGLQDKYWPMHYQLYSNQDAWANLGSSERTDMFKSYANTLGLDVEKWEEDLTSDRVASKIDYDVAIAKKLKVQGTPAIYVGEDLIDEYAKGGKIVSRDVEGSQPIWSDPESFEKLILIPALKEAGVDLDN